MDHGFGNWPTIHALRNPSRPAFIDAATGHVSTWVEFEERTNRLADALTARGVSPGDRVGLLTLNSVAMMEIYFAVAKLGAISVPINARLTASEVNYILRDSGASFVFESSVLSGVMDEAIGGTSIRERVVVPTDADSGVPSTYEQLLRTGQPHRVERDVGADAVCVIMYTSGTTGQPKGAMLTHHNFLWNAINALGFGEGLSREDITISAAPLFHIGALGVHTMPLAFIAGCSIIMESFAPGAWLDLAENYRITKAFNVPVMWAAIANDPGLASRDLSALTFAVAGGAPCPLVVIKALQSAGMQFTEGFGMTETAPVAACLQPEDVIDHAGSIGRPVNHMDFRLVDGDDQPVGVDEVGELTVRGPSVFVGYWNRPEESAHALRGGWFHTGDMARVDADGFYTLVDRKNDMIISGGENVYPIETEQVLYEHPDVVEVAVIGVPDDAWGELVTAVVVISDGANVDAEDLIAWTRARLAAFKVPKRVEFVEQLPRNATGKILKRELRHNLGGVSGYVSR